MRRHACLCFPAGLLLACATPSLADRMRADKAVVLLGVASTEQFGADLGRAAHPLALAGTLLQVAVDGAQAALRLDNLRWFERQRPLRVVIVDAAVFKDPLVLVVPATSRDEVLAALPAGAGKDARGHAARASGSDGVDVFWDFPAGHAVLTRESELFSRVEGPLLEAVLGWLPQGVLAAEIDLRRGLALVASEVAEARQLLMSAVRSDRPAAKALGEAQVAALFDGLGALEWLSAHSRTDGDQVELSARLTTAPDSDLARAVEMNRGPSGGPIELLPAGAWLAASWDFDLRGIATLEALQALTPDAFGEALELSGSLVGKLRGMLQEARAETGRRGALAVATDGGFPLGALYVQEVADAERARALHARLFELITPRLAGLVASELGLPFPAEAGAATSFDGLLELVAPGLNVVGVGLGRKAGSDFAALTLTVDWDHPALRAHQTDAYAVMLGRRVELAVAYGKGRFAVALGPRGIEEARRAAAGASAPGAKAARVESNLSLAFDPGAFGVAFAADPELRRWADVEQAPWRFTISSQDDAVETLATLPAMLSWNLW